MPLNQLYKIYVKRFSASVFNKLQLVLLISMEAEVNLRQIEPNHFRQKR